MASDDSQTSGDRKTTQLRPPEQQLKCPRCDSPNTKFCYYNNYSLTQPRHFCKTCRRYWTKGGALRNVPVGGGCRKAKKTKSSSSASSSSCSVTSSSAASHQFFNCLPPPSVVSSADYSVLSFSRLNQSSNPVFNSASEMGFSGSIASSIESLSSINQDLHWKLQQQRLAMLFGGEAHKEPSLGPVMMIDPQPVEPVPTFHQVPGTTTSKSWFLDNPFITNTTTNSNNINDNTESNWSGMASWNHDMHHHEFNSMP